MAGLKGDKGDKGDSGPGGSQGAAGSKGEKGEKGDPGSSGSGGGGSCPNGSCVSLQASTPGTQETGNVNISGTVIAGGFSGNGSALNSLNATSLASGTVADARLSSNVALLNANQNLLKPAADSTTTFLVQNAAGTASVLDVDTTNQRVGIGNAAPAQALDVTGDIRASGSFRQGANVGQTATCAAGNTFSGLTVSGGIVTANGACTTIGGGAGTLQDSYNNSTGNPELKLNTTRGAIDIQDADTTIGANLFNLRASNGAGLGALLFGVGNTGATTLQNSADSTSAFRIQNAGGTLTLLTADTTGGVIKVGTTGTPTVTGVSLFSASGEFSGAVRIGGATDNATFDATTHELTFSGQARHSRRISQVPEFLGAIFRGDGTSNTGSMTSGFDATSFRNHYKWTTAQATNQDFDIVHRLQLPTDFSALPLTPQFCYWTRTSDITNGTVTLDFYDTSNTQRITAGSLTPSAINTWEERCQAIPGASTMAADGYITLIVKLQSPTSGDVRVGEFRFNYLSKW